MARSNLQIKVGSYTGDGVDSRDITGVGFRPDLVIIKGGNNISAYRNKHHRGDLSNYFGGSGTNAANVIQEMLNDGFQVGTAAQVNTNAAVYYYIAIKGSSAQSHFAVGKYRGTAGDNRNFTTGGVNFTPDFVYTKIDGGTVGVWRTSAMAGDTSSFISVTANTANLIQNLQSNGFQLGTASEVNGAFDYFFWAMKSYPGIFAVGTYTGDGLDNKVISGIGFTPDMVIVKNGSTTDPARMLTTDMITNTQDSMPLTTAAPDANGIKTLNSDGFTVGTSATVNGSGNTLYWIALKAGNYNVPITRVAS